VLIILKEHGTVSTGAGRESKRILKTPKEQEAVCKEICHFFCLWQQDTLAG
jgi:hypothetical protein